MIRERLPNRRGGETVQFRYQDDTYVLTIGKFPDGRIGECFCHHRRPGSSLDAIVADSAVLVSLLLQCGVTAVEIGHSLGRTSDGEPASIVSAMVAELGTIDAGAS